MSRLKNPQSEESCLETINRELLIAEVYTWAHRIGVAERLREIHIRPMKRKWASISTRGRLTLNTELYTQPADFRREVIVHELLHLKLNSGHHGKLFRRLLQSYLRKYQ